MVRTGTEFPDAMRRILPRRLSGISSSSISRMGGLGRGVRLTGIRSAARCHSSHRPEAIPIGCVEFFPDDSRGSRLLRSPGWEVWDEASVLRAYAQPPGVTRLIDRRRFTGEPRTTQEHPVMLTTHPARSPGNTGPRGWFWPRLAVIPWVFVAVPRAELTFVMVAEWNRWRTYERRLISIQDLH